MAEAAPPSGPAQEIGGPPSRAIGPLLVSVFVIATCGLVYELVAGTAASYLLGDSVTQFSTVIGCYLSAMGVGSWLSGKVRRGLLSLFVRIEILVGLIGGFSATLLFVAFNHVDSFRVLLYGLVFLIGTMVGIEIPLLMRILKDRMEFRDLVARLFSIDYAGALFASILFPLVLVPHLGLVRTGLFFGVLNVAVAIAVIEKLGDDLPGRHIHRATAAAALILLALGFGLSDRLVAWTEGEAFGGRVIHAESTPYQRIVLTRAGGDLRLYLNGNLQFSSRDEHRYHEALVHPLLASLDRPRRVLVVGGGDGLALREILRYDSVEAVTLVDLDPAMTRLFSTNAMLTALNKGSLSDPRVQVVNADAFVWLAGAGADRQLFDAVVIDLPDPSNHAIGKLYSTSFYRRLKPLIAPGGGLVVQSTSPLVARKSFWCVVETLEASGFRTAPYHYLVPAFGDWGYVLAGDAPYTPPKTLPGGLAALDAKTLANMFDFPPDMARLPVGVQRLNDQLLVRLFDREWSDYMVY